MVLCPICCEDVHANKFLSCAKCAFDVCHKCVLGYVKTLTGDITCMNTSCKHPWSRAFIYRSLPPSILYGELKDHRKQVLVEREKALLPATTQLVPLAREEQEIKTKLTHDRQTLKELKKRIQEEDRKLQDISRQRDNLERTLNGEQLPVNNEANAKEKKIATQPRIVCPCPMDECRGYVFADYKCSICETEVCKACRVAIDPTINHICNPDDVATQKLIQQDCKACPGCGAPSRRQSGCSQVWCCVCHKAWNWNTREIETGYVHATDYFNYMRRNGLNIAPHPGQVAGAGGCANVNPAVALPHIMRRYPAILTEKENTFITERWQIVNEIRYAHIYHVGPRTTATDLRLKYLNGEIDETRWKQLLHKRDKEMTFATEIQRMKDAYRIAMDDNIQALCRSESSQDVETALANMHAIHDLMEEEYKKLAKCFVSKRHSPFHKS